MPTVMQCSVHSPSPFICRHRDRLLPDWTCGVASVIVVLQRAACDLAERSQGTEQQKHELRDRFLAWGQQLVAQLQQQGHHADLFDPKTGYPMFSQPGTLGLDDVAVVQACLGYCIREAHEGCAILYHPEWGCAVYPSILVSSAPPKTLGDVLAEAGLATIERYGQK